MTPGEINYQAYRTFRNGKTFDGREAPTWEKLDLGIKEAWEEGAKEVIKDYLKSATPPVKVVETKKNEVKDDASGQ